VYSVLWSNEVVCIGSYKRRVLHVFVGCVQPYPPILIPPSVFVPHVSNCHPPPPPPPPAQSLRSHTNDWTTVDNLGANPGETLTDNVWSFIRGVVQMTHRPRDIRRMGTKRYTSSYTLDETYQRRMVRFHVSLFTPVSLCHSLFVAFSRSSPDSLSTATHAHARMLIRPPTRTPTHPVHPLAQVTELVTDESCSTGQRDDPCNATYRNITGLNKTKPECCDPKPRNETAVET
jgi:hypothetical protein